MIDALPILLAALGLILLSAFFAGVETAFTSADRARMQSLSKRGDRRAKLARKLLLNLETVLGTLLVGNNLANVTLVTLAEMLILHVSPPGWESVLNTLIVTPLILVFGEFLPKSIGRAHANQVALHTARILQVLEWLLFPIMAVVSRVASFLADLTGKSAGRHRTFVTRDDLRVVAEMATEQGVLAKATGDMLRTVFELEPKPVAAIMRPLEKALSVPAGMTVHELQKLAMDSSFTRFPVYDGDRGNVIGVVDLRDALYAVHRDLEGTAAADRQRTIREFVQQDPVTVAADKTVGALLHDLRYRKSQMVIVRDAAGGCVGIVTIRDLVDALFAEGLPGVALPASPVGDGRGAVQSVA